MLRLLLVIGACLSAVFCSVAMGAPGAGATICLSLSLVVGSKWREQTEGQKMVGRSLHGKIKNKNVPTHAAQPVN